MFDVWNKRISKTPSQHPQELVSTLLLLFDGARVHVATSAEKEEMCCWCFISCVSYSILLNILDEDTNFGWNLGTNNKLCDYGNKLLTIAYHI